MVLMPEEEQGEEAPRKVLFKDLKVCDELCQACERLGWTAPTRIQIEAIPHAFKGRDVIGIAQTGSGKTGAFAIPVIQSLLVRKEKVFNSCLALSPTRELSIQICTVFADLGLSIGLRVASLVGGVDMTMQAIQLSRKPHVIVGTPGRVRDHLDSTKGFNLRKLEFLILDEADMMLNMDYERELTAILEAVPKSRQTCLFSATMTSKVDKLQKASLRDPIKVECATKYTTVDSLLQLYAFVPFTERTAYLHHILSTESGKSVIVFCDASHLVQKVALTLRLLGHRALPLYGKLDQGHRLTALGKLKEGKCRVLVCTDVASRGLDIPSVSLVINYTLPLSSKLYVHRVGRTARAGAAGRAISLVTQYDVLQVQKIEQHIKKELQELPLDEALVQASLERVEHAERNAGSEIKDNEREEKATGHKRKGADGDSARLNEAYSLSKKRKTNESKFGFNASRARKESKHKK
ncbi:putative ATP-dependent RNA helicase T26G10.1 [Diplonema papillatum]|nr:putative ATP-dependent RNA helicase T26G10.1 [Diplonema papillatum]